VLDNGLTVLVSYWPPFCSVSLPRIIVIIIHFVDLVLFSLWNCGAECSMCVFFYHLYMYRNRTDL